MDNREAIDELIIVRNVYDGMREAYKPCVEAIDMAISALQAQEAKAQLSAEGTTSDLISRQKAIDRINKQREHLQPDIYPQDKIGDAAYRICAEFIERLPSAQPENEERTEEFAQNVPKEDLISRKAAIDAINKALDRETLLNSFVRKVAVDALKTMPSAQPEPQWISVTERLPEEDKDVLVTVYFAGLTQKHKTGWNDHIKPSIYVDIASYYGGDWVSASDEYKVARSRHRVLAWMPLPKEYSGE